MKFGHLADVHIGCWRDPKMKQLSVDAFDKACSELIDQDVDFILIAGDLFHTAIPSLDLVKSVFRTLQAVKDAGIPVYYIAGSHDYSPTGKTMLDVIEEAELGVNVTKGHIDGDTLELSMTEDPSTGAKLTGIIGESGMLDQERYERINEDELDDTGDESVFLFHTAVDELKPAGLSMESSSVDFLPRGFDYYAGGHVHIVENRDFQAAGYGPITYPGPLFPTNFGEIEDLKHGGYYVYDDGDITWHDVKLKDVATIDLTVEQASPDQVRDDIYDELTDCDLEDRIVTVRLRGELKGGRTSDIGFEDIYDAVMDDGAFYFLKNTNALQTESFQADVDDERSHQEIEEDLITEYAGQIDHAFDDEVAVVKSLLSSLSAEKQDGETNDDYDDRMIDEAASIIDSHLIDEDREPSPTDDEAASATASLDAFVD